jgi:uncharacterized protein (DUF488 family)
MTDRPERMAGTGSESRTRDIELCSVGHSTQSIEQFVSLLDRYRIDAVADIRSTPLSRFSPQFNRRALELSLGKAGIWYVFLGAELGGRPEARELYDPDGHVLYGRLAESRDFLVGIDRLLEGANRFRVAMMCSEENPSDCHRFLLVTRVLHDRGVQVTHLRADGTSQRTEDVPTFESWSLPGHEQASLLDESVRSPWKSTRSVSRGSQQPTSSIR